MNASKFALTAVVIALITSGGTKADSTTDAIKQWGLVGTWAIDCSKPAARANGHFTYSIERDDIAVHARDFGNNRDRHEILEAIISPEGYLELRIRFPEFNETRVFALAKGPDGRYQTMFNHDTKGNYTIRDGKLTGNGNPAPWITRCK
jgi:hypothetical protein